MDVFATNQTKTPPRCSSAPDQRLALRRHVHLQRGGAVPDHGARQPRHIVAGRRQLRLRHGRPRLLLLPLHGAHIRAQGIFFVQRIFGQQFGSIEDLLLSSFVLKSTILVISTGAT